MSAARPGPGETIVPAVAHEHYPPRIADDVVSRPRVIDELAARISRHALVQVVAAAGAGKTTAVVQAARALDRSVAWLSLDEWHQSPSRMLDDLVAALEHIGPGLAGEVAQARIQGTGAAELAATIGHFMRRQHALLVVDDCHVVRDALDAVAVLAAVVRRGPPGLHTVLIGRAALPLSGLSVEMHDPDASIRDPFLRASPEEAEQILRAHGSSVSVGEAMEATEGWIAGLVFETWHARRGAASSADPLGDYLKREVRPRLMRDADELLVASSVFDTVTTSRAEALGESDVGAWFEALQQSGLPAVWAEDRSEMHLHPRIREVLRDDLRSGSAERRRLALGAAARAYESEGSLERALELFLEIGDTSGVQRLAPKVVLDSVERGDVASADRYLAATTLAEDPRIVLGQLALASIRAESSEALAVLEPLLESGRLSGTVVEFPTIGALACMFLVASGDVERALEVLDDIPRGRAFDVARIFLSLVRDDPDAPIPSFSEDILDSVLARAVYHRGLFPTLRGGRTLWGESTGVYEFDRVAPGLDEPSPSADFVRVLGRFDRAIAARDLDVARQCVQGLEGWYRDLADVELAIRLERDPRRARATIERMREQPLASTLLYRELLSTWSGGVSLLEGESAAAAEELTEAVGSMRRGDRTLEMVTALVYLAEAEWRLGNEDTSDRTTDDALGLARRQGTLGPLMLALADFPGVLSRRLDREKRVEGEWHTLGRALIAGLRSPGLDEARVAAHLREFGKPTLVVDGSRVARPKIRKSLELLSYLLWSPAREVTREAVLNALWNGRDDESTRAYLRQALRHLRDVLPDGLHVETTGDSLRLEGVITSESLELEVALAEAARDVGPGRLGFLLDALAIADRGEFLNGSTDVQWVDDRRSRLQRVISDARLDAAELLLGTDRHLRALALVDEALDADPLLERAWRLRMLALDLLGDYDGVAAAYSACRKALSEIGLEPSSATVQLARSLRH